MSFSFLRHSLVRQIAGAAGGAALALALYGMFSITYPSVRAMLPAAVLEIAEPYTADERKEKQNRILEEVKRKAEWLLEKAQD